MKLPTFTLICFLSIFLAPVMAQELQGLPRQGVAEEGSVEQQVQQTERPKRIFDVIDAPRGIARPTEEGQIAKLRERRAEYAVHNKSILTLFGTGLLSSMTGRAILGLAKPSFLPDPSLEWTDEYFSRATKGVPEDEWGYIRHSSSNEEVMWKSQQIQGQIAMERDMREYDFWYPSAFFWIICFAALGWFIQNRVNLGKS